MSRMSGLPLHPGSTTECHRHVTRSCGVSRDQYRGIREGDLAPSVRWRRCGPWRRCGGPRDHRHRYPPRLPELDGLGAFRSRVRVRRHQVDAIRGVGGHFGPSTPSRALRVIAVADAWTVHRPFRVPGFPLGPLPHRPGASSTSSGGAVPRPPRCAPFGHSEPLVVPLGDPNRFISATYCDTRVIVGYLKASSSSPESDSGASGLPLL